jgi:hypothetical protein
MVKGAYMNVMARPIETVSVLLASDDLGVGELGSFKIR